MQQHFYIVVVKKLKACLVYFTSGSQLSFYFTEHNEAIKETKLTRGQSVGLENWQNSESFLSHYNTRTLSTDSTVPLSTFCLIHSTSTL